MTDKRDQGAKSACQKTGPRGTGVVWAVDFPDNYAAKGAVRANNQLAKAGAHLARLLKAIFP